MEEKNIIVVKPDGGEVELHPTEAGQEIVVHVDTTTPQNGTEQIIVSAIELGFVLIVGIIVGIYIKFRNHPLVSKLNIDPETLKGVLNEFMSTYKEQAKQEAVKKAREKDVKIPGVHDMSPEEIKAYEEKAKGVVADKLEPKAEEEKK